MSARRTAARLSALYPPDWRERYGDELQALIVDMSGEGGVPWRQRADVVAAAGREWLRRLARDDREPRERMHRATAMVLCAWAAFMIAGAIVQKSSEHWQAALGGGRPEADVAFAALIFGAALGGSLVLSGIALTVPAMWRFLRDGNWPRIRRPLTVAAVLTAVWIATGAALIAWVHGLGAGIAWGLLGAAALAAWTAAAIRIARQLTLPAAILRIEGLLAIATSVTMAAMTVATGAWWVIVGSTSPGALSGTVGPGHSPLRLALIVALTLMIGAVALATAGARRAAATLPELTKPA